MTQHFTDIAEQLERAARNGTKAHLAPELVRALIQSPAYSIITAERTKELVASWAEQPTPGSNSEHTGSNTGRSEMTGPSAGTMQPHVHAAAERLASEAAQEMGRRKRRAKPSPAII
ncbi:conserved hypothetical protein [Sphingomonas aurantiaca]|uniref:Uncharacterized protein n=1 Tax=Sphingomonas aurantiaca TaxID=185949 RepID=A0A5E7ZF33_9SPHN|nr:conserved hypothetical protein [Sphingomonas aurantiaca]